MSRFRKLEIAIRKFAKPHFETVTVLGSGSDDVLDGGGYYAPAYTRKEWSCSDWCCQMEGKGKKPPKHGARCSLSLLEKYGATQKLANILGERAHSLDYEGGGYSSCPICKGETEWKGKRPRHKKNCPGGIAHGLMEASCVSS